MLLKDVARQFDLSIVRARSALRAALFHFVFVASVTAMKSTTNALYLARRDPQNLPYLYLATAFVVGLVTVLIGRRLSEVSAKPVLRKGLVISSAVFMLLSLLAALDVRASLGALYVVGEVYATALSVLFWARLGEVFDVREGKRVFGAIAALGMAGAVVGGLLVKLGAGVVPSETWCFVAALSLIVIHPLLGGRRTPGSVRRERVAFAQGLRYAVAHPFPRGVGLLVLFFAAQTAAIDYVFRTGAHAFEQGNEASMAGLFGMLNALVGVASILFQTLLTARLLFRFGVFAYLSIVPVLWVLTAGWSFFAQSLFVPLFLLKTFEMMASFSINQPAFQLLYNPMPPAVRGSIRAVIDGAIRKLGGAFGGVGLIIVGSALAPKQLLALVLLASLVIIVWIRMLRAGYLAALEEKLGGKERHKMPVVDPTERATREHLLRALREGNERQTLAAVSVLENWAGFDLGQYAKDLIAHPSERVRLKAVELVERFPDPFYEPFLVGVLRAPGGQPKAHAARALTMVAPSRAIAELTPVLEDPERAEGELLAAAISAFHMLPDSRNSELAERALTKLIERGPGLPFAQRRSLVRLLGIIGPGPHARRLKDYLFDQNATVRLAAIDAAGKAKDLELPPVLISLLGERTIQRELRAALVAYGDEVIDLLARTLNDRRVEVSARVQIPRILRQIGSVRAAHAMLFSNVDDDAYLRFVIIEELGRMRRNNPELEIDQARTHEAALRRLRAYNHYRPIAADLSGAEDFELLYRAAQDRVQQNLEAALRVLGLIYGSETMENAARGALWGDRSAHGDAVEIVDVALESSEIRREVLKYLEPGPAAKVPGRELQRAFELVEGRDVLLAMIARETLCRLEFDPPDVREPTSGESIMPKPIIDRMFLLQTVQPFHGLSVDDLAAVAAIAIQGHAEPREVIYREGEPGDSMYVIISGEIHLLAKTQTLLDLHTGDSFGQTSILDGGPRPVTAKAGDEGVDFMRIERQALLDLMVDRPELMTGLLAELAARIRELIELGKHPATNERRAQLAGGASPGRGSLLPRSASSLPPRAGVSQSAHRSGSAPSPAAQENDPRKS